MVAFELFDWGQLYINNNITFFYSAIPQVTLGSMHFAVQKNNKKKN